MLVELRVENLLLIEQARLELAPGLNVLTGETGAGKTVLAQALDLLLGGRARAGVVRPGTREAYVEGVFDMPDRLRAQVGESLAADADEIVLSRRVSPEGRTRAYVNGRSASVAQLAELAGDLIAFYGQHEHRKLALAASQLEVLDGFCGPEQAALRSGCARAHARVRELEGALADLQELARARDRELDLLEYELAEIDQAALDETEHGALLVRRERLRRLDALRSAATAAIGALAGDGGTLTGATELLAGARSALEAAAGADPALEGIAERMRGLALEADDLSSDLHRYGDELELQDGGLEAIEDRLAVLERLIRRHGGSIAAVLDHAERCRTRRHELVGVEVALDEVTGQLEAARAELGDHVRRLRRARAAAAPRLAEAVRARLAELAMPGASFEICLSERTAGPIGADGAEFTLAVNPGVVAGPLREIASGGELSRVMLALMSVTVADSDATLVFDEVDAGIGGHTARVVGERLQDLAEGRQVLCITHLPQIASLAARHFAVTKDTGAEPARTVVEQLHERDVVSELVRMLGAGEDDAAARRHARQLRRAA